MYYSKLNKHFIGDYVMNKESNLQRTSVFLSSVMRERLRVASEKTGFSIITLIRQGIEIRLTQLGF